MKKFINGKTYNTDTAKVVGEMTSNDGTFGRKLYKKRTGEFFIAHWEHPYYTIVGIRPIDKENIDSFIWDKLNLD